MTNPPVVKTGMLIRRPVGEVFEAFVDPAITTRFWFTRSSGRLTPGAQVKWEWEMYGVSTHVKVREVDKDARILADWGVEESPTTIEWKFFPQDDGTTYVQITNDGFAGDGDSAVAAAIDSMGGFTMVLCALKALLEHDLRLTIVADAHPVDIKM
ncbi:SRPBCC family protein [Actinomadura miaoliensis]